MTKQRLLFVDDENAPQRDGPYGAYMWYYSEALREAGFDVVEASGPDEAVDRLLGGGASFDLVLLDIMMPWGRTFGDKETSFGLRTGISLLDLMGRTHPQLPIVVLTNVQNTSTLAELWKRKSVKCVLTKSEFPPMAVVREVQAVLGGEHTA